MLFKMRIVQATEIGLTEQMSRHYTANVRILFEYSFQSAVAGTPEREQRFLQNAPGIPTRTCIRVGYTSVSTE